MTSKYFGINIILRTFFLFASVFFASYFFIKGPQWPAFIFVMLTLFFLYGYYTYYKKAREEIMHFTESVHYRDFTRYFEVKKAPSELKPFRSSFNEINSTFKILSKEKETQFLHLKTILEIVDTGILSYETNSGEVLWMNESLKNLLHIPYLKTIHSLEKRNEKLYAEVLKLNAGNKTVFDLTSGSDSLKIQLVATVFENEEKQFKLVAFQNINEAMDESESKAWQKLLSVMTHEIMNSVAPISSLAETMKNRISEGFGSDKAQPEAFSDIETGIETIKKRSDGLLKFTETYRNLSKINKINPSRVLVLQLFEHVQQLMQPNIEKRKIEFEVLLKDPLISINADSALIEQVLINLVLNAMDAVKETELPKIILTAEQHDNKIELKIQDNGSGIANDLIDKIFVPFFSTKKTGNGIGLSLCKQVMMLHKGQITVKSQLTIGTTFVLMFSNDKVGV